MKKYILPLLLILILASNVQAATGLGLWTKGTSAGAAKVIRFYNNYLIMDSGRSVRLLDNSNSNDPLELDAYPFLPVLDIIVYKDLIFVFPQFNASVSVFKISESNKLEFVKKFSIQDSYSQVTRSGDNFIFLCDNKFYVYELTNDINLNLLSTVPVTTDSYSSITAYNDRCIVSLQSKIFIYDISNPSVPFKITDYETGSGTIRDMKVNEGYLYLSGFHIGLKIVSLADENNPSIVSSYYLENTFHFTLENNYAFIWDNILEGVQILDITDVYSPTEISKFSINANQYGDVYYYQNKLYVCNRAILNGLQVWSIDNTKSPEFLFEITSGNSRYSFKDVIIYKNAAILNCVSKGIIFANKSNYNQLEIISQITEIPSVNSIATYSNLLLVHSGMNILIYDIQNTSSPNLLSTIGFSQNIQSFAVDSGKIYITIPNKFFIYSISTPNNPLLEYESPGISPAYLEYRGIKKMGNTIHISVYYPPTDVWPVWEWVYVDVYDITTPSEPSFLVRINTDDYPSQLYEYKGIYYGIEGNKLKIYNFDDPRNFTIEKTILLSKKLFSLKFDGNLAYGSCEGNNLYGWEALLFMDISNPNNPTEMGVEDLKTGIVSYAKDNDIFYFSWYENGVSIYEVNDIVDVKEKPFKAAVKFENYPNPFNPATFITFNLRQSSKVKIIVYNLIGQKIAAPLDGFVTAGNHAVKFDGTGLPSGVYLYTIEVKSTDGKNSFNDAKKMILLK